MHRFIIALPKEIPKDIGHLAGYSDIPKTGTNTSSTALEAVSSYLHRKSICPQDPKLVMHLLNQMGGSQKAAWYTFNLSDIASEGAKPGPDDQGIAEEVLTAEFLARSYGGRGMDYLEESRRLLMEFETVRRQ